MGKVAATLEQVETIVSSLATQVKNKDYASTSSVTELGEKVDEFVGEDDKTLKEVIDAEVDEKITGLNAKTELGTHDDGSGEQIEYGTVKEYVEAVADELVAKSGTKQLSDENFTTEYKAILDDFTNKVTEIVNGIVNP